MLAAWAAAPRRRSGRVPFGWRARAWCRRALGAAIAAAVIAWLTGRVGLLPVVSAALLGLGWTIRLRAVVKPILLDADRRAGELKLLALLLARLERESFAAPLLVDLRRALETTAGRRRAAVAAPFAAGRAAWSGWSSCSTRAATSSCRS